MKRAGRRFDMYVIGAEDVERLCAWKRPDEVRFSYDESRRLRRVRKRNTSLFDALADIAGHAYAVSDGVLEDVLYEAIMVDFAMSGNVRCLDPGDAAMPGILPAVQLQNTLYERGFFVAREDGTEVHFVPFVASASMSREEEYLFVNEERLDALLRAVSLDMVGAVNGMPVLDGMPAQVDPLSPFGGLQAEEKVASVPKLAAYLGLALSDGVSLREVWAAEQPDPVPVPDEAARARWLLGLNEHNTVCVADWDDAPMHLDAFDHCWVNEEAPLPPAFLRSRYVAADKQTDLQKELQAFFRVLRQEDRAAFDEMIRQRGAALLVLWQQAIDRYFDRPHDVQISEGAIPQLLDSPQGTSVYLCAVLYAACLQTVEGEMTLVPEKTCTGDETELGRADLKALVAALAEKKAQNRLWKLMHDEAPGVNTVLRAESEGTALRVGLRRAPSAKFRAVLRKVSRRDRFGRGNQYDGCGFLDDALFDRLERMLLGEGEHAPLNAVQVRLPWCKGLLVRFTASEYFRTWAQELGQDPAGLCIRDIFGMKRPLFDENGQALVQAVFTGSMFKGAGWFRRLEDGSGRGDRWAEYWRRLRAHGASMLIAGRSTAPGTTSRLNYQFLTTLGMTPEELHKLVERRLRVLGDALLMKPIRREGLPDLHGSYRLARQLMGLAEPKEDADLPDLPDMDDDELDDLPLEENGAEAEENEPEDDGEEDYLTLLGRALVTHPDRMADTDLVMGRFDKLVRSEVLQMMRGRLPVDGDVRYLLPDLLQMVRYMARKFLCRPNGRRLRRRQRALRGVAILPGLKGRGRALDRPLHASAINDLGGDTPYGRYYAPGSNVPWVCRTGKLGKVGSLMPVTILRNPHYAMGEEPILYPLDDREQAEYDRWFGKLTGCVMTSAAVMYTINGADCDGDRVNVCAEPRVLRAIRRRAARENALLAQMIHRRAEVTAWLGEQAQKDGVKREARDYYLLLQRELATILPDEPSGGVKIREYLPPLIYTGSAAKGRVFSRNDLQGGHLRRKLWDAFCVSRRQRIGQMSLRVLELTPDAYGEGADAPGDMSLQALTGAFLARYLVCSSALDTAMEIDMAKTGAQRENHELKSVPADVRKLFGHQRASGFYAWRRLYKRYESRLNGYAFNGTLEAMMREFCKAWKPPQTGALALDLLPMTVYHLYAKERAEALGPDPVAKKSKEPPFIVHEKAMAGRGRTPVCQALMTPPAEDMQLLQTPGRDGMTLLDTLLAETVRYDKARRLAARAGKAAGEMTEAYDAVLRWLLNNGFSLDGALAGLDAIHGMFRRWRGADRRGAKRLCDVYAVLAKLARSQAESVRWGWTRDAQGRAALLEDMLRRANGDAQAELPQEMILTEAERALLTCSRRSIVLVRCVAEYGSRDALMHERAALPAVKTPEELERDLRAIIRRAHPARVGPLFYAACRMMRNTRYRDDSGVWHDVMSDFMMTYLLRKILARKVLRVRRRIGGCRLQPGVKPVRIWRRSAPAARGRLRELCRSLGRGYAREAE